MRVSGNRVLAADHPHDEHLAPVVHAAGCLVIHSIRQEPGVLRHIPRWERWTPDNKGYSAYRRALDCERSGDSDAALREYDHAIRYEPGNFLISIRKAALLEVMGRFKDASEVYRTCNELWPEHIETAYRLSASYANDGDHIAAEAVLKSIQRRLRPRILRKERAKTWLVTHWNVGERRYWRSLSRRHPPIFGSSNRHQILAAVQVAEQVREISRIALSGEIRKTCVKGKDEDISVDYLIKEMARLTARGASKSPYRSLFHPEKLVQKKSLVEKFRGWRRTLVFAIHRPAADGHDSRWHNAADDENLVIYPQVLSQLPWQLRPRKRLGWLAHYNAACFYSIALSVDDRLLPPDYSIEEWKRDCARAAIRELGHVRRDPFSKLKPEWYRNDPELQPLTSYVENNRWAKLVGL
jgi:tetratricopeptide (TPR) repeat protein